MAVTASRAHILFKNKSQTETLVQRLTIPISEPRTAPHHIAISNRIPALDGLRGLAILSVLLFHWLFNTSFEPQSKILQVVWAMGSLTWSGVDLFFVLSGFLIGGILLDARDSPRYFKTFYIRRAFRILPLYGLVVGAYLLYVLWRTPHLVLYGQSADFSPSVLRLASYLTFTQNFWMAYLGIWGSIPLAATWSLAVEEQFYLTIPLIVRTLSRSRLTVLLIVVVIASPCLRAFLRLSFPHGNFADYVLMPCRADALCLGALTALLVRNARLWDLVVRNRHWIYAFASGLLTCVLWFAHKRYFMLTPVMVTVGYSVMGLFYTMCLLVALFDGRVAQRFLCSRYLMRLGGIAYCTYLLHEPAIEASRRLLRPFIHSQLLTEFGGGLLGILLTLLIATLSMRFFEKPLLRRGHAYEY